jgi:hypothetical protein
VSETEVQEERDDRAILAALEVLGNERPAGPAAEEIRPWLELLGQLPGALDEEEPSASVKRELMATISAAGGVENLAVPESGRATRPTLASPWILRLAAVLALALLGLSVKQASDLSERSSQIEIQAMRIEQLRDQIADIVPAGQRIPDWMVASGTELCELRPRTAGTEESRGWVFVREDHQHWYVTVEGLAPTPEGQVYELWFMVEGQAVSGGQFHPDARGRAALTSESMPTGITGFAVTLQPVGGDASPSESTVLYGDEVMLTL